MIGPVPLAQQAKQKWLQINMISLYEINKALEGGKDKPNITDIVPTEYDKFLPLFSEVEVNKLPPHHVYDHHIPLKEDFIPLFGCIYSLSRTEVEALKRWLEENLSKGFNWASSSPTRAPILL